MNEATLEDRLGGKTSIMLGAGASKGSEFELPTMASFFTAGELNSRPALRDALNALCPDVDPADYNLEDILSFLDLSRNRHAAWGFAEYDARVEAERMYREVIAYVRQRLHIPPKTVCGVHRKLFEKIDPRDTVITLNYDLIADYALEGLHSNVGQGQRDRVDKQRTMLGNFGVWDEFPASLLPDERDGGLLIKLHGSLGWKSCVNAECQNSCFIYMPKKNSESTSTGDGPCRFCGGEFVDQIIPPVATKRAGDRGRIAFLWHLALRRLIESDRVAFIGVSFAPSDFELRWLVRQAFYRRPEIVRRVDLVDPRSEIRDRIFAILPAGKWDRADYDTISNYADAFEY